MRVSCVACEARFFVEDELVRGGLFKFACKRCQAKVFIDGRPLGPRPPPTPPRARPSTLPPPAGRSSRPSLAPPPRKVRLPPAIYREPMPSVPALERTRGEA